jgi:hypothetical protein
MPAVGAPPPRPREAEPVDMRSHSTLMYWWPVWLVGFLFAAYTAVEDTRFIPVPPHTHVDIGSESVNLTPEKGDPKGFVKKIRDEVDRRGEHLPRMSHHAWMGTIYCFVLLLVIVITNVSLRGLWSVIIIISLILLAVLFYTFNWLAWLSSAVGQLHIYIGFAGYLFISTALLMLWCLSTFLFDRQVYIIFTPGQMRVCDQVGAGENVYDTTGMQIEKLRSDFFRHFFLGLEFLRWIGLPGGTGDVIVKTSGAQAHTFELRNVFNINTELREVEGMQRSRQVVAGP